MKKIKLYLFFVIYVIFLETMTHYFCYNNFEIDKIVLFCIPIGLFLGIICELFKKTWINRTLFIVFSVILSIIYCAQIVYFNMYESFFSLSSILMAGQVVQGTAQIFTIIIDNIVWLLILFIPLLLALIFHKIWDFSKLKPSYLAILLSIFLIGHGFSLYIVTLDKEGTYSDYEVYNNTISHIMSVERFGIITTLRLDIEKGILNDNEEASILTGNIETPSYKENNKINYNKIEIDWQTIIDNTSDKTLKQINTYFSIQTPTKKNEYTGMFANKNVIFILAESLYKPAISEKLTPTLYKMMTEGFNFENYYVPLFPTSTADGEYMLEWSLYPILGNSYNLYNSRKNFHPYGFVNAFSNINYKVSAYHGFAGYYYNRDKYFKEMGFDDYGFCDTTLNMKCSYFHASDLKMVQNSISKYIDEEQFFTYYISISGHGGYGYDSNFIVRQNWNLIKNLDYSNYVKGYLAGTIELERALEYLMATLEKAGKLKDTVFVISPDHWPYYFKAKMDELEELTGDSIYDKFELHKNVFIVYNSEMEESITVDKITSSIDVLPTLLNLMGIEYDSRLLMGKDMLSKEDSLVIFSDYSWINELGRFDGEKFIPANDEVLVTDEYIETINNIVKQKILVSSLIQKNNYYKSLFNTIEKLNSIQEEQPNNQTESEEP